ncbi:MAG: LysR family transcriptional regulator [Lachnospiraceae bacterium]|nr:LysR family transcriptional regulator [Lachnospiraceae bacterium]
MEGNLNLYYIFYTVATCRNISAAAKELYISQPAISKAISKLEQNLQTSLFIRNSRGVSLTDEGEYLYGQVKTAFSCIQNGEKRIKQMNELGVGHISIGVSTTLCKFILLPYLSQYIKDHPHMKIKISCQTSSETMQALENGSIDLGLIGLPERLKDLSSTPLMEIQDTFVTTESYLKNLKIREGRKKETALKNAVFMMLNSENITRKYVEQYLDSLSMKLTDIIEVGNMDLLIEFAKIDLGIACVIREFVGKELENKELSEVTLGKSIPKRDVGFVYSSSVLRDNPAVPEFIDYIAKELKNR